MASSKTRARALATADNIVTKIVVANARASVFLFTILIFSSGCSFAPTKKAREPLSVVKTLIGAGDIRFGEVFGVAIDKNNSIFFSDGAHGKIWRVADSGGAQLVTDKLDTPSGLAIDSNNRLIVADAGSHTIKRVNTTTGEISLVAGVENKNGYQDGDAVQSLFQAPIGVAVYNEQIFVADTYNDKIRLIENNSVKTLAGAERGFKNSFDGLKAQFDTPCGIAVAANGEILIADTGNRRIRQITQTGAVTTFAGTGEWGANNGASFEATFAEPIGVSIDEFGVLYVADAGTNSVRAFGRRFSAPVWEIISGAHILRGTIDGDLMQAKFNRPANIAVDAAGKILIADSANKLLRVVESENNSSGQIISADNAKSLFLSAEQIKNGGEPRWTFEPFDQPRDIAGTFGEVRGAIKQPADAGRFHNGLDIAGALGETTGFIRTEKVLRPFAAEDFDQKNNRERLRMPTIGYIHIRLGRNQNNQPFDDARFLFDRDITGKLVGLRVPRGAKFLAGEPVGTLNGFNHVHLIAGESGAETNALAALTFPGVKDFIAPKIEKVIIYNENWREVKSDEPLGGKIRIVVRAFDQMDGNNARRRLGVYRLGYQILNADNSPALNSDETQTTISFERLPENETGANLVYAFGSQSGYTPNTVFNYIVTNHVRDGAAREDFFDATRLANGNYKIRVFAWDYFGNQTTAELIVKILN